VGGERLRGLTIDVGYRENFGFRQAERKRLSMHTANAAGAYESEMNLFRHCALARNSWNLTSY
jgi:hypothetical protein